MAEHRSGPIRSAAARESILEATARLFAQRGYDHLTIEGIAKEAGVSKQTVYRWWPTRGALIAECMVEGRLVALEVDVPDTGDIRRDLTAWIEPMLAIVMEPRGASLLRSLISAAAEDGAVGDLLSETLGIDQSLSRRLTSAVEAGQLPEGTPVDQLGRSILGAIILTVLGRRTVSPDEVRALLDYLVRPMV